MAFLKCICAFALFLMVLPSVTAAEEGLRLHEQEIKAGLLYNFLKYTDWPAGQALPKIAVCIFGNDPLEEYLHPMAGRTVNQREIVIRNVHDEAAVEHCQLLFVGAAEKDRWPELHSFLANRSILSVSDFEGFARSGGMIEFGRNDNHINVDLNIDATAAAGLRVQERLLRLVTIVHPTGQP